MAYYNQQKDSQQKDLINQYLIPMHIVIRSTPIDRILMEAKLIKFVWVDHKNSFISYKEAEKVVKNTDLFGRADTLQFLLTIHLYYFHKIIPNVGEVKVKDIIFSDNILKLINKYEVDETYLFMTKQRRFDEDFENLLIIVQNNFPNNCE